MKKNNEAVSEKDWDAIPVEEPDDIDLAMLSEIEANSGEQKFTPAGEVSKRLSETRAERKRKGDLHVRIASSLHEDIIDAAFDEGVSLNQYVATALEYYAGVRHNEKTNNAR